MSGMSPIAIVASVASWLAVVVLVWGAVRVSLPLFAFGGACCLVATALELYLIRRNSVARQAAS